ncbi:dihydroxyacetone kinase subunit DhaL [Streptococcus oricebi]|uniref:Dihydroxyacetone kinase subunit L n=1 Tax=Streptococcus oricebi TaxID=1547447 RepID=A0ABS5B222_9STRE|nr:dihydroxyacetone kinase subunit DhaL [Streptococcus oricebi]MBP2622875.1 dihydroxyacetone kinase subunit L [Streptococcus oricebi]
MEQTFAKKWLLLFNEAIQREKDYLSELDTPIGDGDHGGNMARGMAAVQELLNEKNFASTAEIFQAISMQLISKVGGASGPLYGSAFMGMMKAEKEGLTDLELFQAGLEMIVKRGKAQPGEKTMVDVWTGVLPALGKDQLTEALIDSLLEQSKDLKATKGRASYLGERSIGHIDPGSYSSVLLFKAYLEAKEG